MFQLSVEEVESLTSQIVISNAGRGGRRYLPYAFTEHGVVMHSSVLKSQRAVQMNIFVARAFVRLREIIAGNKDLATRIEKSERGHENAASVIEVLVEDIDRLADEMTQMKALPPAPRRHIGFRPAQGGTSARPGTSSPLSPAGVKNFSKGFVERPIGKNGCEHIRDSAMHHACHWKSDRPPRHGTCVGQDLTACYRYIEAVRQAILTLPITPRVLANLRETARLFSTHYSTMIEGNRP
jgi:hypothetical protein